MTSLGIACWWWEHKWCGMVLMILGVPWQWRTQGRHSKEQGRQAKVKTLLAGSKGKAVLLLATKLIGA